MVRHWGRDGRRYTDFCELNVSPGLNGVAMAQEIAAALGGDTAFYAYEPRKSGPAVDPDVESGQR